MVPLAFGLALRYVYAPDLDRHVRKRYGADARFAEWREMPSFLPSPLCRGRSRGC